MNRRFADILELDVGSGSTFEDYQFLYGLTATLRPERIIEIGTNMGGGAIVMALALRENDIDGQIVSYDISADYVNRSRQQVTRVLGPIGDSISIYQRLSESDLRATRYDLALIDGDHEYAVVKKDFDLLAPVTQYIVLHDAQSCPGVAKLCRQIGAFLITDNPPGLAQSDGKWKRQGSYQGWGLWRAA